MVGNRGGLFQNGRIAAFSTVQVELFSARNVDELKINDGRYDAVSSFIYALYSAHLIGNDMKFAVEVTKNAKLSKIVLKDDSLNVIYIIGESYIKSHSRLYGYYLPTTPNLSNEQKKGRLFVFDNVVSPCNKTTTAMKNTFSCNSLSEKEKWSNYPFFPAIFSKAGYKVYFWDAQRQDETSQAINEYSMDSYLYNPYFLKSVYSKLGKKNIKYDNDLVEDFAKTVKLKDKYNLIIFHLMGQHVLCSYRYPNNKKFNKFNQNSILRKDIYLNSEKKKEIAEYDNATFYNDFVLNNIINLFKNKNAVILYFSDHGEEVYDYRDSQGRAELDLRLLKQGLKCQYDVPFMIWCSDKYRQNHPKEVEMIKTSLHKPFMTDDLCNVLFDLGGINTPYYKPTRDLLCPNFRKVNRIVEEKYNYDSIVN